MRWIAFVLLAGCAAPKSETVRWSGESHVERRAHPTWALQTTAANGDWLVMDAWSCTTLRRNEVIRTCDVSNAGFEAVASRVRDEPGAMQIDRAYGPPGSEDPGALWQPAGGNPDALRAFEKACACYQAR